MNRDINAFITLYFKGVTINKMGTLKYADTNSCVFSLSPYHHSLSLIKMIGENVKNMARNISAGGTDMKYEDAFTIWSKFLDDLNESTYGLFVDSPIKIPFTYDIPRWYGRERTDDTMRIINKAKELLEEMQNLIDTSYNLIKTLKAAAAPAKKKAAEKKKVAVTEVTAGGGGSHSSFAGGQTPRSGGAGGEPQPQPVEEVAEESETEEAEAETEVKIKVKTKAEKAAEYQATLLEHSEDFDPAKWAEQQRHAEAILKGLPVEIKKLKDELEQTFNFPKRGKLVKLEKELENYPAYLAALKTNCAAKQNYYNDGYQSKYNAFKQSVVALIKDPAKQNLLKYDNTVPAQNIAEQIIKPMTTAEALIHFARSPALRYEMKKFVAGVQSSVNRLRNNKAVYQANVDKGHALVTLISTVSDATRDYFVTDIWQ